MDHPAIIIQVLLGIITLFSWLSIFHVLRSDRKPEVTIGWVLALFSITPIALPAYWIFGFRRYYGYSRTLREAVNENQDYVKRFFDNLSHHRADPTPSFEALQSLTPFPLTKGNSLELLVNGEATYEALFEAIRKANHYVLVQYFIIDDDDMGKQFLDLLMEKAAQGIKIYLLYDYFGSRKMERRYGRKLKEAGIDARPFRSPRIHRSIYHINFRNHRKIVVVDGLRAFTGGLNIGSKYLGPKVCLRDWRDTHLKLTGSVAFELQSTFLADWYWTTGNLLESLQWKAPDGTALGSQTAAVFPTGPADNRPICALKLIALIQEAKERLWITTPYLVPNEAISMTLEAAVRRGVDVRILTTAEVDHHIVFWAGWFYVEQLRRAGVKVFRYNSGFMHQKIMLVDSRLASVGTVNLDPRSYDLNFEVTVITPDTKAIADVEAMLTADFENASENLWEWEEIGPLKRTLARFFRLFSPLI